MKDFSRPRTFILSAERSNLDARENYRRTTELGVRLGELGVPHAVARGRFQGAYETSYIVTGAINENLVAELAREYNQDSYLAIAEHDRAAYLVDAKGYHKHIGRFTGVGPAEPSGDFTESNGFYYQVIPCKGVDLPEGF